ncbi:MAG: hypothetical protein QOJ83_110, partial [Frankiales bacterium]|nr:hypothetical protein [Frankiales bacterium]
TGGSDMLVRLLPSSDSARLGRRVVTDALNLLGRHDLVDDATLVVSELIANGVLHARTEISLTVETTALGIRVAVTDGSSILPRAGLASPSATSGRGLLLVERLSTSWGVELLASGGKVVWADIEQVAVVGNASTAEDLLELWDNDGWPSDPLPETCIEVRVDVDVQLMLASRVHTDDLVRELQLTLINASARVTAAAIPPSVLWLARRLDAATEEFHDARRQMYGQTLTAAKHGFAHTTLHLQLHRHDAGAARRWLEALDEADTLTSAGILLLPPFPIAMTTFRRDYIAAIIGQVEAAA